MKRAVPSDLPIVYVTLSEHDMLITLASMALKMNDLTGHDVIEALRELGHGSVVEEARK